MGAPRPSSATRRHSSGWDLSKWPQSGTWCSSVASPVAMPSAYTRRTAGQSAAVMGAITRCGARGPGTSWSSWSPASYRHDPAGRSRQDVPTRTTPAADRAKAATSSASAGDDGVTKGSEAFHGQDDVVAGLKVAAERRVADLEEAAGPNRAAADQITWSEVHVRRRSGNHLAERELRVRPAA